MRWLRLCCLVVVLASLACPAAALAAGPADGPGCLGVSVDECLGWLRATMTLDEGFLATVLARRQRVDVNGARIGGLVTVTGKLPARMERFVILLHIRPDDRVERVEANLPYNLIEARAESAYDRSALYEVVWRLLGRRCAGVGKMELYRFFENIVKPRIVQVRHDIANGLFGLHRIESHAGGLPICGVTFGYTNLIEWRGSADTEAGRSPKSFSSIELR